MNWVERKAVLEQMLDRALEPQQERSQDAQKGVIKPSKDEVMIIIGLIEGVKDCRWEAERDADSRKFCDLRAELREIAGELPETIVLAPETPMSPQIVDIMRAGQRLERIIEDLDRLDL